MENRGIRYTLDLPTGLPRVVGNPVQLETVIINLVRNAIDALDESTLAAGHKFIGIQATVIPPGRIRITVRDNGVGLARSDPHRLFEAGYTTKSKGLGLGLNHVYAVLSAMGGTVRLEANTPTGTLVTLEMPASS